MDLDAAVARLPRWLLGLAATGTVATGCFLGLKAAGGFLLGSVAAWVNLRLIERAVSRIGQLALTSDSRHLRPRRKAFRLFIQMAALLLGAFVILRFSGFSMVAVLCGFFVCPAAAILEIVYELVKYEHS